MKSRKYTSRIEIWETSRVKGQFSGSTVTSERIAYSWAEKVTDGLGRKAANMGITEFNDPLLFRVRHRNDLSYNGRNLFIKYKGEEYIIQAIKNEDLRDVDIEIFCTKREPETVPKIGVIRPITDAITIEFGNSDTDMSGNLPGITFQYQKDMLLIDTDVSLDFQLNGQGKYIYFRVPTDTKVFTSYIGTAFFSGPIPDQVWRDAVTSGDFDYYLSRDPVYLDNDIITFSTQQL